MNDGMTQGEARAQYEAQAPGEAPRVLRNETDEEAMRRYRDVIAPDRLPESGALVPGRLLRAEGGARIATTATGTGIRRGSVAAEAARRKAQPLFRGLLRYFPDALCAVANCSYVGNEQHNPGTPMHWDRDKSVDEADALMRHLKDAGRRDADGVRHTAKVAWRALALLQKEMEADGEGI
jgi:hypothetical protein